METDEEMEMQVEAEADTDEKDDIFFDTKEFLGADLLTGNSSFKLLRESPGAESPLSRSGGHVDGANTCMTVVDSSYPLIERRKRLPEPKEIEKSVSLWSLIKDNIGKDLTKVCLPVYFNEPISFLQKSFEDMEYSYLLDRAYEYGKQVSEKDLFYLNDEQNLTFQLGQYICEHAEYIVSFLHYYFSTDLDNLHCILCPCSD